MMQKRELCLDFTNILYYSCILQLSNNVDCELISIKMLCIIKGHIMHKLSLPIHFNDHEDVCDFVYPGFKAKQEESVSTLSMP